MNIISRTIIPFSLKTTHGSSRYRCTLHVVHSGRESFSSENVADFLASIQSTM